VGSRDRTDRLIRRAEVLMHGLLYISIILVVIYRSPWLMSVAKTIVSLTCTAWRRLWDTHELLSSLTDRSTHANHFIIYIRNMYGCIYSIYATVVFMLIKMIVNLCQWGNVLLGACLCVAVTEISWKENFDQHWSVALVVCRVICLCILL